MSSRRALPLLSTVVALAFVVSGASDVGAARVRKPVNFSPPTISGLAMQGQTLTASTGSWTGLPTSYAYAWKDCGTGATCVGISGATTATLTLATRDVGHTIEVAVTASNTRGSSTSQSAPTSGVTVAPDTTPPSTPTGLSVGSRTATSVAVSWSASSDNVGVAGYGVYSNGSLVASPASTSYTLTGLSCGTSYTVAVDAYDAAGNRSAKTTITTATSSCADTTPPSTPTGLSASFVTQSAVTLSWSASSDNIGVAGYDLYAESIAAGTSAQTSYAFSSLSCGMTYTLGVDAYDAAGNRSPVASLIVTTAACADTSPPTVPTNLQETASTTSSISAGWTGSSDNVGVTGYRVFVDSSLAGTTATTSYAVTGLSCGTSHQIVVDAFDAAGNRSGQISATMATSACPPPPPGDTQPPSAPTGLVVSSAGQTSLALGWSASSDNVGVTGYGVYKNGSLVASPAGTSYTLSGLTCGTSYTIAVDAFDAAGNRSAQATVTTSTAACPDTQAPTVPSGITLATRTATSISITWTASTDNVGLAGYDLFLNGSAAGIATTTSYTFTGLVCGTNYTIGADAYDGAGNHSAQATTAISTSACPDTTPPSTPTALATSGVGQTSLTLSWNASTDNVGVTGYRLFQNGSQVGTSSATSYGFSSLACGTSYTLGVAAVDAAGNVSSVATISGTTAACSGGASANVYVSTAGNDSTCVRGNQGRPCLTFAKACQIAQAGDLVSVADGTYAGQDVSGCVQTSPGVTFQAATQHGVLLSGGLSVGNASARAAWITFDGIDAYDFAVQGNTSTQQTTSHITINHMNVTGHVESGSNPLIFISNVDNFLWENSTAGPLCCNQDGVDLYGSQPGNTNVTFDHVNIRDISGGDPSLGDNLRACDDIPTPLWPNCRAAATPYSGNHVDAFQTLGVNNLTITNSHIGAGDEAVSVQVGTYGGATISNWTFSNDTFTSGTLGTANYSFNMIDCASGTGIQAGSYLRLYASTLYNDFAMGPNCLGSAGEVTIVGNIFNGTGCPTYHTTFSYNLLHASGCGGNNNTVGIPTFMQSISTSSAEADMHLQAGSKGIDLIPNATPGIPPTDQDGTSRPQGPAEDAGAYEYH